MKKVAKIATLVSGMILVLGLPFVHAFSSATHIYIAQHVFGVQQDHDLNYGSIAPDLALYTDADKWPTAFDDTHYDYADLRRYATFPAQKAFSRGWLTHNEEWGADYYAHIFNPVGNRCVTSGGYVIDKACLLAEQIPDIGPDFAHLVVEIAIDVLLCNKAYPHQNLGERLLDASVSRSLLDPILLSNVLVAKKHRTDRLTLATTELTFRGVVDMYALPLRLPSPQNEQALAALGVQLAALYGLEVTEEQLLNIIDTAIGLCTGDYEDAIETAILGIRDEFDRRQKNQ